jgi:hypothetical protein
LNHAHPEMGDPNVPQDFIPVNGTEIQSCTAASRYASSPLQTGRSSTIPVLLLSLVMDMTPP